MPLDMTMVCPYADQSKDAEIYYPNTMDCNSYYKCDSGRALLYFCDSLQHFNIATNKCDLPENSRCLFPSAYQIQDVKSAEVS